MASKMSQAARKGGGVSVGSGNVADIGNIVIGGNVTGTVVIGEHTLKIDNVAGGGVNVVFPASLLPTTGKGMWIWKLEQVESGNLLKIRKRAQEANLSYVVVKVADGENAYGKPDQIAKLASLLKETDIRLLGFHYVYGKDTKSEAKAAIKVISSVSLDGYIIDAETDYSSVGPQEATEFLKRVHDKVEPNRLGLTSFRYPSYQNLPWEALLDGTDFVMPQVYWESASNPAAQLERSVQEYQKLKPDVHIVPIGAAYTSRSWKPKPDEINEFMRSARMLQLPGVGFWNWDTASQPEHADLWEAISSFDWEASEPEQVQEEGSSFEAPPDGIPSTDETGESSFPIPVITEPKLESQVLQIIHNDEVEGVEDKLGYKKFIDSFVQLILDEGTKPPLTIGISGAWGSGKSFILSNVSKELKQIQQKQESSEKRRFWQKKDRPAGVHVIQFNAWEYNATEAVWPALVRKILDTLEEKSGVGNMWLSRAKRNVRRQINDVSWKLVPWVIFVLAAFLVIFYFAKWNMTVLFGAMGALGVTGLISLIQTLISTPTAQWVTNLFSEREYGKLIGFMDQIQEDIAELGKNLPAETKIVIMIDDLDRCSPDKIVEVLEAIKLLLNFELFIVAIAVDSNVITRAVEKRYEKVLADVGRSGHAYLDKIIQIPFYIPEPSVETVNDYLFSLLTASDEEVSSDSLLNKRELWSSVLNVTPRAMTGTEFEKKHQIINVLAKSNELTPVQLPETSTFSELVWQLISIYWPVSGYLLHRKFSEGLSKNPSLYSHEDILPALLEEIKQSKDIQAERLQRISDAPVPLLEEVLGCDLKISAKSLADILQEEQNYIITRTFNPTELEAFQLLAPYLIKNPRHIKRMVNTYSLIRILAARTPDGKIVIADPEAVVKWLIISAQWPMTTRLMLFAFNDIRDNLRPGQSLPDDDNILTELHTKALERLNADEKIRSESHRLDNNLELLKKLVSTGRHLSSKQLDLLRNYSISFNQVFESLIVHKE